MKVAKKQVGVDEILVPGERGNRLTSEVIHSNEIEVEENLLLELKKVVE